jgi:hypothetical protein
MKKSIAPSGRIFFKVFMVLGLLGAVVAPALPTPSADKLVLEADIAKDILGMETSICLDCGVKLFIGRSRWLVVGDGWTRKASVTRKHVTRMIKANSRANDLMALVLAGGSRSIYAQAIRKSVS